MVWIERVIGENETEKVATIWPCEKRGGGGGLSTDVGGVNGSAGKDKGWKTKENLERYSDDRFGYIRSG